MTRILYSTDAHFKAKSPVNRRDNYAEAIARKQQWITDFGNEKGVDLFLNGGDLFDKPVQSAWELNQIYDAWCDRKAPTKGVTGNHPIRGNAVSWSEHSGILILERMGLLEILDPFKADIEIDGFDFRLHHTDLVRSPVIWDHVLWSDYDVGESDVVLISHYHPRQGYHLVEHDHRNVWFISPGAVSRGSLAEDDLSRQPACTLITISGRGKKRKLEFEHVVIPHEPAEVVFDMASTIKLEDVQHDDESLQEALESFRTGEGLEQTLTPLDLLRVVHGTTNTSQQALEHAIERIQVEE